jgi:RNA polymerase sigma-70 factor (ECF subfamily)
VAEPEPVGQDLLDLYDRGLPAVYGYLVSRCGSAATAEDLTADTFLAAVTAVKRDPHAPVSVGWLIGTARHKLVDHWRRSGREERHLRTLDTPTVEDPWETELDVTVARDVLSQLGPHHRSALTLRYLDGLSVPEVAECLERTVHATEALLVRARGAFRTAYGERSGDAG